jgi:hypothetical protein
MKKWYSIQFLVVSMAVMLYSVWNVVFEAYGISLRADIFGPACMGTLVTSGVLFIAMTIIKGE